MEALRVDGTASERRGNTLKGVEDFFLKAEAIFLYMPYLQDRGMGGAWWAC